MFPCIGIQENLLQVESAQKRLRAGGKEQEFQKFQKKIMKHEKLYIGDYYNYNTVTYYH